jgi:hypothetical protein
MSGVLESGLPARMRLHQSWYRAAILGLDRWGCTPPPTSRPLGSILTEVDAAAGLAFTSSAAEALYIERRTKGWGVDPLRVQAYLGAADISTPARRNT